MAKLANSLPFKNITQMRGIGTAVHKAGVNSARIGVVGAFAGAGFDMVSAGKDERADLRELVEEYRPEIAEKLGVSEEQVSAADFEAAYAQNIVLAQAKEAGKRDAKSRTVSGIASVVMGTVAGMGAAILARRSQTDPQLQKNSANIASGIVSTVGSMMTGKLVRKNMKSKTQASPLQATAHARIMDMKDKQQQGVMVTPGDIFSVQLALDPDTDALIKANAGKTFDELTVDEQNQLIANQFPPQLMQACAVMAQRVNDGARPQGLLFGEIAPTEQEKEAMQKAMMEAQRHEAEQQQAEAAAVNPQEQPVDVQPQQAADEVAENPEEEAARAEAEA
ncbi:MAG: hypothetical protein ACPG80_04605, partial [Rickettsiales bacterium]